MAVFARIGSTAFGGGSATIASMRQACLRHQWMDERQFVSTLVLSRLTPGISILAQALLIGRIAAGIPGMFAALTGLLAPALVITCGLTWLYEVIHDLPAVAGPLHTVVATAAGFTVALTLQLMRDVFRGQRIVMIMLVLLVYTALAFWVNNPLIVMASAIFLALLFPAVFDSPSSSSDKTDSDK
ncbi:chromate transporter [[Pantoea] beijingensis]|nr:MULTISPECIES: chromate transporter [Erwiniaceae]